MSNCIATIMNCLACRGIIKFEGDVLACTMCGGTYHFLCLNITTADFMRNVQDLKKSYKCPDCTAQAKRSRNDDTPLRGPPNKSDVLLNESVMDMSGTCDVASESLNKTNLYVNTQQRSQKTASLDITTCLDDSSFEPLPTNVSLLGSKTDCTELTLTMTQFQKVISDLTANMQTLTNSMAACQAEISSFRSEMAAMKKNMHRLEGFETEVKQLRGEVTELRHEIARRDRIQLLNDVEIMGVTEHKGENVNHIVAVVADKLGVNLDERDVVHASRVGRYRIEETDARPRPIVLSFSRRAPRDQLLRAARVRRHLSTDQIQVPGAPRAVYVNEHLSKNDRRLFALARAAKKEYGFKYVWKKNGQVLIRTSEGGPVININSEKDISTLCVRKGNFP